MKKMMLFFVIALIGAFFVTGCSSQQTSTDKDDKVNVDKTSALENDTEEIEESSDEFEFLDSVIWEVEETVKKEKRLVVVSLKNESPYDIVRFKATFSEKPNLPEQEREQFFVKVKELGYFDDEHLEELKIKPIGFSGETKKLVASGQSVNDSPCHYYKGTTYLRDITVKDLCDPDIFTIEYVMNGKIHTAYYDFNSEKYSYEEDTEEAYDWGNGKLSMMLPHFEGKVVDSKYDYEESYSIDILGCNKEDFYTYVDMCKKMKYTVEADEDEEDFSAMNSEGYRIYVSFDETHDELAVSLSKQ